MTAASTKSARSSRGIQTAGRSPEELRELVSHWGAELELAPAEHIIEWAGATFGDRFCVTSSMGDAVLAHLASTVIPDVDVVFLDTGYHFVETIGTRDAVASTLDLEPMRVFPVSAQKGLVAKVQGDERLLEASRLPLLEEALIELLVPAKQKIVRDQSVTSVVESFHVVSVSTL